MKKISQEEYDKQLNSKGNATVDFILSLANQESCFIENKDWKYRTSPTVLLSNRFAKKGILFKVSRMKDGFLIKRIS